jgi:hypothetical protein
VFDYRQEQTIFLFFKQSRPALGAVKSCIQFVPGAFCCLLFAQYLIQGRGKPRKSLIDLLKPKSKSKVRYDQRSVGQPALVSSRIWGLRPDFCYYQTVAGLRESYLTTGGLPPISSFWR